MPYRSIICQLLPLRSSSELRNDEVTTPSASCALVLVAVIPRDVAHEEYALSKINDKTALRNEINERLMNHITVGNLSVISVGPIERIPGEMIHFKWPYRLYYLTPHYIKYTQIYTNPDILQQI